MYVYIAVFRMPARLGNSVGFPKGLDPRRENKLGAFVLIKSAFQSVPSAVNCRAITLHGEDLIVRSGGKA